MANYLYNGVALPKIPDAPSANSMATFTRATIIRTSAGGYRMYWSGSTYRIDVYTKSDGTEELYAYNRPYNFWSYYWDYKAATNAWVYGGGGAYAASTASACFPAEDVIWTNYDLKYVDGTTVYLASSEPVAPTVTGITLNQTAVSLNRGGTFQFSAVVSGTGSYDDSVTYSLSGNSANGGTTLTAAGLLTIGANESSPTITVTATSVQDSAVSRSAVVTVADFVSKITILGLDTMTWNAADGYLETVMLEGETGYKVFDRYLTYEQLESAVITAGVGPYTETIPLAGQVTEFPYLPGFVQFMEFGLSITDELALELGLPSGGIWLVYDLTTEGVETVSLSCAGASIPVTDTTATVNFSCKNLLDTDSVYRIAAWVYEKGSASGIAVPCKYGDLTIDFPLSTEYLADYPYVIVVKMQGVTYGSYLSTKNLAITSRGLVANEVMTAVPFVLTNTGWVYSDTESYEAGTAMWTLSQLSSMEGGWNNFTIGGLATFEGTYPVDANGNNVTAYGLYTSTETIPPTSGNLDTTLPATWTSELFSGPDHSESHTFEGLTPATDYAVYGVIWLETDQAASEHNATATFRTLEGEETEVPDYSGASLDVSYEEVTTNGAYLEVDFDGIPQGEELFTYLDCTLDDGSEARENPILVDNPPSDNVSGVLDIYFNELEPNTEYTATFRLVYQMFGESGYTDTGVKISHTFTTLADADPNSFPMGFASGLSGVPVTKANADHNRWMQGYIVGSALRKSL